MRASAWSLRGSSSPKANADDVGTSSSGDSAGAGASQLESQPAWLQPAVALAKAGVHDVRCQVGKAPPHLGAAQQLDIGQPPPALRGDQVGLQLSALIRPGDEKIPLVAQAQIHLLLKLIEEG